MIQPLRLTLPQARARGATRVLLAAGLMLVAAACSDSSEPVAPAGRLSLGKAPAGPSVSSASPAYGHRDTTVTVRVLGSGFSAGAVAEWALAGVPDAAKIRTNSTEYVSPSELIANITISADADLRLWDITVTLVGGKKGVGTEKFEVTTATVLGAGTIGGDMRVEAMNDQGSVAGYAGAADAFVYDNLSASLVALGGGQAWGIDALGTTALGRDAGFNPVAWVRGLAGGWTVQPLPSGGIQGIATRTATATDGSLIASGWLSVPQARRQTANQPVLWRRVGGVWQAPEYYVVPGSAAAGYDIASGGQMAGRTTLADGSVRGVVWHTSSTYTVLDGIAYAINDAGTIVVGELNGAPAYWYRNSATGAWTTGGTRLPSLAGSSCVGGRARDLNDSGIVVGWSCAANGKRQATVWSLDLSGPSPVVVESPIGLGGLGVIGSGAETSAAQSVTSAPPYTAVGGAASPTTLLVSWSIP